MQHRNRKRMQLILIGSLFVVPFLIAAILVSSGWSPGTRSFGVGIVPQQTVENVTVNLADGSHIDWHDPEWRWSLVAIPGHSCAAECIRQMDLMHRAQVSLNKNAKRLRLVYLGEPPEGPDAELLMASWLVGSDVNNGFEQWKPDVADGVTAVLVKPDGIALTVYPDGFDATGLRKDLAKVTK